MVPALCAESYACPLTYFRFSLYRLRRRINQSKGPTRTLWKHESSSGSNRPWNHPGLNRGWNHRFEGKH